MTVTILYSNLARQILQEAARVGRREVAFRNARRRRGAGGARVAVDDAVHDLAGATHGESTRIAPGVGRDGAVGDRPAGDGDAAGIKGPGASG